MKNRIPLSIVGIASALIFSMGMFAQELTEVTVQVKKDGKVVKDTTYRFEDAAEAKNAVKMMEILSGDDSKMMKYNYTTDSDTDKHSNTMVFISEDGKTTEIKEFHGDSLVWISEEEHDGDHVNVIRKEMKDGDHPHGEHVMIMKSDGGETIEILIDEDEDGNIVKKKEVKVMVSGDEDGTWTVDSKELNEIMEENDGENVKVIVIKTKQK